MAPILNSTLCLLYAYCLIAGDIKLLLKAKFKSLIRERKRSETSLWSFQSKNGMLECCDSQLTFRTGSEPVVVFMTSFDCVHSTQCGKCGCATVITLH